MVLITKKPKDYGHDDPSNVWGFGQVVSIVLLGAPLITLVEYFSSGKCIVLLLAVQSPICAGLLENEEQKNPDQSTDGRHPEPGIPLNMPVLEPLDPIDEFGHPDNSWDDQKRALRSAILFSFIFCLLVCASLAPLAAVMGTPLEELGLFFRYSHYVTPFTALFLVIMGPISIDKINSPKLRPILDTANIIVALVPFVTFTIGLYCNQDVCYSFPWWRLFYIQPVSFVLYIAASTWHQFSLR